MILKRGGEWTVSKVIAIVLAIVILVILIFGIGPKGIVPLRDKIYDIIDNTLVLFGLKKNINPQDCYFDYSSRISDVNSLFVLKCKDNCSVFLEEKLGDFGQNFSYFWNNEKKSSFASIDGGKQKTINPDRFFLEEGIREEREIYKLISESVRSVFKEEDFKEVFSNISPVLYISIGDNLVYARAPGDYGGSFWYEGNYIDGFKEKVSLKGNDEEAIKEIIKKKDNWFFEDEKIYYRIGEVYGLDFQGFFIEEYFFGEQYDKVYYFKGEKSECIIRDRLMSCRIFDSNQGSLSSHFSQAFIDYAEIKPNGRIVFKSVQTGSVNNRVLLDYVDNRIKDYFSYDFRNLRLMKGYEYTGKLSNEQLRKFLLDKIKVSEKIEKERQEKISNLSEKIKGTFIEYNGKKYPLMVSGSFERPVFYVEIDGKKHGISHDGRNLSYVVFSSNKWDYHKNYNKFFLDDESFSNLVKLNNIYAFLKNCFGKYEE